MQSGSFVTLSLLMWLGDGGLACDLHKQLHPIFRFAV